MRRRNGTTERRTDTPSYTGSVLLQLKRHGYTFISSYDVTILFLNFTHRKLDLKKGHSLTTRLWKYFPCCPNHIVVISCLFTCRGHRGLFWSRVAWIPVWCSICPILPLFPPLNFDDDDEAVWIDYVNEFCFYHSSKHSWCSVASRTALMNYWFISLEEQKKLIVDQNKIKTREIVIKRSWKKCIGLK